MDKFEIWFDSEEIKERLIDADSAKRNFYRFLENHPYKTEMEEYLNKRRFTLLVELIDKSECIKKFLMNHPEDFKPTIDGLWYRVKSKEDYIKEIKEIIEGAKEERVISERFAYYKHRELLRIFSKEILGVLPLEDILREYSYLADALLEVSYETALKWALSKYGEPFDGDGKPAKGAIIGLGKLGSEELNYYSDIDVLFIYSSDKGSAGNLSLPEFFSIVFEKVVKLLSTPTKEGIPYEVDLDLRPFGKSGAIAVSLRSAELYYESYGRTWERFALLRARPVAGDIYLGNRFIKEVVEPFVFRKSIDYSLIEEIRFIKARIDAEGKARLLKEYDVKTGRGGIRELEFAVQTLVLLLGGKNPYLKERNTFRAIWKLHQKGIFSSEEVEFLEHAYAFLRKLEHRIQLFKCLHTQKLVEKNIPVYAKSLGYGEEEFRKKLEAIRKGVFDIFTNVVSSPSEGDNFNELQEALLSHNRNQGEAYLLRKGFKNPSLAFNTLEGYIHGRLGVSLSEKERREFIKKVPVLIEYISNTRNPDQALKNFDKFMTNPNGKHIILSDSNGEVLKFLSEVFSLSSYLSTIISRYPDILEDVLTLYQEFPSKENIEDELEKYKEIFKMPFEDILRRFKRVWELRIGLVYIKERGMDKLIKFFYSLSNLADVIMEDLWNYFDLRDMLLIALGKYGSEELNYGSDLDIVFVTKDSHIKEVYSVKVQDFIRFITKHTPEGYLYDVDVRLRPMGSKGEIAPTIDFFRNYFKTQARIWERFAWTRARIIRGSEELKHEFARVLNEFLFSKPILKENIKEMFDIRMKLEESAVRKKGFIDIKLGKGGLMDAEFIVQYFIINENLRENSIIKALDTLQGTKPYMKEIRDIYMFLRTVETQLRISKDRSTSVISPSDISVISASLNMEESEFLKKLKENMETLRDYFIRIFG